MRTVIVFKYVPQKDSTHHKKVEDGKAKFHAWGVDYEEFETGPGSFSTAIIERDDGTVENVPAEMVKFISTEEQIVEVFAKGIEKHIDSELSCEHGRLKTEYCQPCGRIHGG